MYRYLYLKASMPHPRLMMLMLIDEEYCGMMHKFLNLINNLLEITDDQSKGCYKKD